MPPRSTKGRAKATPAPKTKTATKRSLPEEDEIVTQPAKRQRSSTVSGVAVEATVPVAAPTKKPTTKAAKAKVTKATKPIPEAPAVILPDEPIVEATETVEKKKEIFAGAFELFSMNAVPLNIAYAPVHTESGEDDESFHPEALYKAIQTYRTKKVSFDEDGEQEGGANAKLTIPIRGAKPSPDDDEDEYDEEDTFGGTLTLTTFQHPYCGGPIQIALVKVSEQPQEELDSEIETDLGRPEDDAWNGPGISACLEIQDDDAASNIPEASGKFCMRPLWKGVDAAGKVVELFEGSLTFQCVFARVWQKRGGKGVNEELVFWAVRKQ